MDDPIESAHVQRTLAVVTPVFNDWAALAILVDQLNGVAASLPLPMTVVVVDDGSTALAKTFWETSPIHLARVELISLHCNLGHQRAIAIGISECVRREKFSHILVMDCDGEDAPSDIPALLRANEAQPAAIIVARRTKRSEGEVFRLFYAAYKVGFRCLTGKVINFGNFCLLPESAARRLAFTADTWNHLAAAVVKSRLPLQGLPIRRARRYAGKSSMNFVSLMVHGFSAISVFSDTVLTRLFVAFGATCLAALASALTAVFLRLFTELAIPGWATNVFGLSALLFLQSAGLLVVLIFTNLSNRSAIPFVPGLQSASFILQTTVLYDRSANAGL